MKSEVNVIFKYWNWKVMGVRWERIKWFSFIDVMAAFKRNVIRIYIKRNIPYETVVNWKWLSFVVDFMIGVVLPQMKWLLVTLWNASGRFDPWLAWLAWLARSRL